MPRSRQFGQIALTNHPARSLAVQVAAYIFGKFDLTRSIALHQIKQN
jgi:hypothetical protein